MFRINKRYSIILVQLAFILIEAAEDYCNTLECPNPKDHVLCQYPTNSTGECGGAEWILKRTSFDEYDKKLLLSFHNYSMKINPNDTVRQLQWDNDLELMAQRWAQQCPKNRGNDVCRSLNKFKTVVQQNVWSGTVTYREHVHYRIYTDYVVGKFSHRNHTVVTDKPHPNGKIYNRIGCGYAVFSKKDLTSITDHDSNVIPTQVRRHVVCNYAGV